MGKGLRHRVSASSAVLVVFQGKRVNCWTHSLKALLHQHWCLFLDYLLDLFCGYSD